MGMDINKLKAEHPEIAAALIAEGVAIGAAKEKDRINAHLTMGEASGDMKTALAAVEDGSEMTATLTAKYMAAGMNKNAVNAHLSDTERAALALKGVATDTDAETEAEAVAAAVEKKFGITADTK